MYELAATKGVFKQVARLPRLLGLTSDKRQAILSKNFTELLGGVQLAFDWNYRTHIDALEAEVKRVQA